MDGRLTLMLLLTSVSSCSEGKLMLAGNVPVKNWFVKSRLVRRGRAEAASSTSPMFPTSKDSAKSNLQVQHWETDCTEVSEHCDCSSKLLRLAAFLWYPRYQGQQTTSTAHDRRKKTIQDYSRLKSTLSSCGLEYYDGSDRLTVRCVE